VISILIAPWVIRNYNVTGQFVFLDTRTGFNLYIGYNPNATGTFNFESATELNAIVDDVERHNWGMERAVEYIKENPAQSLLLMPKKFFYLYDLDKREYIAAYSRNYIGELHPIALSVLFFLIMSPFALVVTSSLAGIIFSKLKRGSWLLLSVVLYFTALYSLTLAESRMHIVFVPFLIILASKGIFSILDIRNNLSSSDQQIRLKTKKRLLIWIGLIILFICIWIYGISLDWVKFETIFSPGGNTSYVPY
jgi:hypothetical protein